jgi:deazaflavin-dependent oxidoreductase (nitroreductase family)
VAEVDDYNAKMIEEFRANGGIVGDGMRLVLLTTTGAKSGTQRTNPVAPQPGEDGVLYVFASKAGAPSSPDWYHNLVTNPKVIVEYGTETYEAIASTVTGPKRDEIYARQVELLPVFAEYQSKTDRVIPVVELRRA